MSTYFEWLSDLNKKQKKKLFRERLMKGAAFTFIAPGKQK